MNESKNYLRAFTSSKSKYFELADGEKKEVRFLRAEVVSNPFDGGRTQAVLYYFEEEGKLKEFTRTSRSLAQQMAKVPDGSRINIKRTGKGNETKYFVGLIKK